MDVHISSFNATVRAVDDRTLVSPDVLEVVVAAVLRRLEAEQGSAAARRDDASLWGSVREGSGR